MMIGYISKSVYIHDYNYVDGWGFLIVKWKLLKDVVYINIKFR